MQTLQKSLSDIAVYHREEKDGKLVRNKCGRDFLYYTLNYRRPEDFNLAKLNPLMIDAEHLFGIPVASSLSWTQLQFLHVADALHRWGLELRINDSKVSGYVSFVRAILCSRKSYKEAITMIETAINNGQTVGIDISLGFFGLLDHVLFVYGYDEKNLYVIDAHRVKGLEYEPVDSALLYFKLPKEVVRSRWTRFGRVWEVTEIIAPKKTL